MQDAASRLVRAGSLDVTGLLALVADALTPGLGRAVTREMANLAAVVALLAVSAVTSHVAESTARVASLRAATTEAAAAAAAVATVVLAAVARNVSDLTALVAFLAATLATLGAAVAVTTGLGAITRDVARLAAAVAGLLLGGQGALAANVALATAVVASRGTLLGAVTSLVRDFATVEAATSTGLVVHDD